MKFIVPSAIVRYKKHMVEEISQGLGTIKDVIGHEYFY